MSLLETNNILYNRAVEKIILNAGQSFPKILSGIFNSRNREL
jgi:hypothetical protein